MDATSTDKLLTTGEASSRLNCSISMVNKLCASGDLPGAFKLGRVWRVPESAIPAFIKSQQEAVSARYSAAQTQG